MILNRKGFTLIEVMIAVTLFGILMISIQGVLRLGIVGSGKDVNYYGHKIQARYAMNRIIDEIKANIGTTFDSTNNVIKASDGTTILINANPTNMTEDGDIFFYFDPNRYGTGDGYGELRGQNGRIIAKYIKDFKIEYDDTIDPSHKLLKVTLKSGRRNSEQFFEFATYIQLY
jgi:prepilin-type N-terminal cleavage/methylation domain-containing protein